jgi:all-trans-retinol 13,14-reductase
MSSIATPYKRAGELESFDAIVIGSGIGGLTAAALLARLAGLKVLVLERHYTAGGYTHTFRRPGYEWDVGVHYVGSVHPKTLFGKFLGLITDGTLEWADMGEVYDRIVIGDEVYDLPRGRKALKAALTARFPGEEAAIARYFELIGEAARASGGYFLDKVLPGFVSQTLGPRLTSSFEALAGRTTREVLEELTSNERLIAVLTGQWGDYGLAPSESSFAMHAMLVQHYIHGAVYPVGGSARIAESIVPVIEASGGRVLVRAEVEEILVEDGCATGVRMADGAFIEAPIVISGAGLFNTFARLLPRGVASGHGLDALLARVRPSAAHLCLYIGLEHSAEELGLEKANRWVYPDEHIEANLARAETDPSAPLPLVYLSFPSAKDPDFARRFPGRATIEAITVAPYGWVEKWRETSWKKRGEEYEAFKEELSQRLLETLYEQVPQVRGKVAHYELSTPLTTQHFCAYEHGEIYGLDHTPERFRQRFLRPRTPVDGLYLTGQDIATCGVAGGLFGGVLCAAAIITGHPALLLKAGGQLISRTR